MDIFIIAQIFGLLGALSMLLSSWQKTRKRVLALITLDSILYFVQYLLLGALSGALSNIIGIIRTTIFMNKEKYKILQKDTILYLIITLYIIIGIFSYDGIISTFPVIVSILYSVVLWQDNVKTIRIGSSIMILSWLIYNISVGAYVGAIIETILFISSLLAVVKIDILKKQMINTGKQIDKKLKQ